MTKVFDPVDEMDTLREYELLTTRNFMVAIYDSDDVSLFRPCVITNLSTDKNKMFITMYDMIAKTPIESVLDDLQKGFWIFKKKINIVLYRLDKTNSEIYRVEYHNCKLKNYHGKNFTYNGDTNHQWYLELTFGEKKIVTDARDKIKPSLENLKKEQSIIRNSNKMLDDAIETVKSNKRTNNVKKERVVRLINKAKSENAIKEHFLSSKIEVPKSTPTFNLDALEKDLKKKITDLEDND